MSDEDEGIGQCVSCGESLTKQEVEKGTGTTRGTVCSECNNGGMAFERDLAVRQLKVQHANETVAVMALKEARPLEALRVLLDSVDEVDDAIETLEEYDD